MSTFAAIAVCAILTALAVFQLALIAGAPIGRFAWGGQHRVLPAKLRVGSATSIVLYALFAIILLQRAGLAEVFGSDVFVQVATWVLFGYFALGILMNGISRSKAERNTMVPVTAVLAVLSLIVALG
ncbi:MAG TPA: hypothetical protein VFT01_12190 [Homoserinimonas sp.]|nr:hypothetical protein [Homoserinimonas sp.]